MTDPVIIEGAGMGQTVFRSPVPWRRPVFTVSYPNPLVTFRDLTIDGRKGEQISAFLSNRLPHDGDPGSESVGGRYGTRHHRTRRSREHAELGGRHQRREPLDRPTQQDPRRWVQRAVSLSESRDHRPGRASQRPELAIDRVRHRRRIERRTLSTTMKYGTSTRSGSRRRPAGPVFISITTMCIIRVAVSCRTAPAAV